MSSGVAATARSSIVAHGRVVPRRSPRARRRESASTCRSSASSISVASNRLPRLSGASCGWSGSMIAAPSIASSLVGREHGEGVDVAHVMTAAATSSGGRWTGSAPPARSARRRAWRAASARSASRGRARRRPRVVLCTQHASRGERRRRPRAPSERVRGPRRSRTRPCGSASASGQLDAPLDGLVALAVGCEEAHARRRLASAADSRRTAAARGRTSSGCRRRRPAGRRSRTASASRSSSRPACTGRARSPPTAACRRAPRASLMRSRAARRSRASKRVVAALRPCARRARRACRCCSRTQPPPG